MGKVAWHRAPYTGGMLIFGVVWAILVTFFVKDEDDKKLPLVCNVRDGRCVRADDVKRHRLFQKLRHRSQ